MHTVEEKLAKSLTAESTELIPYLPYLLQDLWELGSSPTDVLEMILQHVQVSPQTRILDLACGKGAVSVKLARELGCLVRGIDIMPDFIDFAAQKAQELGVGELCQFMVEDITKSVAKEKGYDMVIFGAVGDVLGSPQETIALLKHTVKSGGHIILDDAYGNDAGDTRHPTRVQWLDIFACEGLQLIAEKAVDKDELTNLNNEQQECIAERAEELKARLPEKAPLFDSYTQSQLVECEQLENEITGVTLLLRVFN